MRPQGRATASFVGAAIAFFLIINLLKGRTPEAVMWSLAAWVALMVGYHATVYVTGKSDMSFAAWATSTAIGALLAGLLFVSLG